MDNLKKKPYLFSVEGNIGSGKSTLVKILQNKLDNKNICFLQEPVDEWSNFKDDNGITIPLSVFSIMDMSKDISGHLLK